MSAMDSKSRTAVDMPTNDRRPTAAAFIAEFELRCARNPIGASPAAAAVRLGDACGRQPRHH